MMQLTKGFEYPIDRRFRAIIFIIIQQRWYDLRWRQTGKLWSITHLDDFCLFCFRQLIRWRWSNRISAAGISFLIIAIFGTSDESGDGLLAWSGLRILDTMIGVAIAVVGTYLIRPREKPRGPGPEAKTA